MRQRRLVTLSAALCTAASLGAAVPQVAAAIPSECSYVSSTYRPTLTQGHISTAVKQAQCLSNMWGGQPPKLTLDGVFDSVMLKKVKWIQGCHGLPESGVIDPNTWRVLYHPALDCYLPYPP
ncbi:peptidoglycan-binding domain-containing protein [Streptomyces himalayensis]|uniref:Peptidoglycan-binding protein n=1 Tax=Streptomyces himalayensis subsp. himalayensis TaxID=2756131 RepID=A0A7W0DRV5_9ACTN|nr:peptidoglycan-binding protein [Streptomyces himalayensis]MBA2950153.1 peptidoglycan-binding protein [Streptomyces himalayensis subsp. himalayensis]